MNNSKMNVKFILIILILSFLVLGLFLLTVLLGALSVEPDNVAKNTVDVEIVDNTVNVEKTKPESIEQVIAKYKCQYISREGNVIYIKFNKDLYNDNGSSNENYFKALVKELATFFLTSNFELVDEEKAVSIKAVYDYNTAIHNILFNGNKNYYDETDGKQYIEVQNAEIIETSIMFPGNIYLDELIPRNMFFSAIERYVTERKELESGYVYFPNEHIKVRLAPNKGVMNIVFMEDFDGYIFSDVEFGTPLHKVAELHPDYSSGSVGDGYLGYRNGDLYYFFYDYEVSVYGYLYKRNKTFETALEDYLNTKDLVKFKNTLSKKILSYDVLEYDEASQSLFMYFPTRGIKIDIQGNDPKGITLYSNFCFSDITKQYVKDGKITFKNQDLVQIYEKERRNSN